MYYINEKGPINCSAVVQNTYAKEIFNRSVSRTDSKGITCMLIVGKWQAILFEIDV